MADSYARCWTATWIATLASRTSGAVPPTPFSGEVLADVLKAQAGGRPRARKPDLEGMCMSTVNQAER